MAVVSKVDKGTIRSANLMIKTAVDRYSPIMKAVSEYEVKYLKDLVLPFPFLHRAKGFSVDLVREVTGVFTQSGIESSQFGSLVHWLLVEADIDKESSLFWENEDGEVDTISLEDYYVEALRIKKELLANLPKDYVEAWYQGVKHYLIHDLV